MTFALLSQSKHFRKCIKISVVVKKSDRYWRLLLLIVIARTVGLSAAKQKLAFWRRNNKKMLQALRP